MDLEGWVWKLSCFIAVLSWHISGETEQNHKKWTVGALERNWARFFPFASLQLCPGKKLIKVLPSCKSTALPPNISGVTTWVFLHCMHTALRRYSLFLCSVYLRIYKWLYNFLLGILIWSSIKIHPAVL